jgi:tetratricopeptide (TPR) repeat protein
MRGRSPNATPSPRWASAAWFPLALIALAIAAVYSHTLRVPFYLDDFSAIRENDLIYQWRGVAPLWQSAPTRLIPYLTLALNYHLGRFDPFGYHVFNILTHFLASVAAFGFARGIVRTPRVRDAIPPSARAALPLVVALLFALHPLQTQAVTYIVQRLSSLVALFYLTALAAYVQARLASAGPARIFWSGLCALATILAFLSKENSATLPVAIALTEMALFEPGRRRALVTAGSSVAGVGVFWLVVALARHAGPLSLGAMDALSRETPDLSRGQYLAVQTLVVLRYLRLFVLPTGLHLDYAFPPRDGVGAMSVALATSVHLLLFGVAIAAWRRRPVLAFGVLFYYLTLAVESSVIPIRDVIFEHRTYLPNFGLCLCAGWGLMVELPRTPARSRVAWAAVLAILISMGTLTWLRNRDWLDPIGFWRSNAALAPTKPRVWATLGRYLLEANRPAEGERALREAIRLRGSSPGPEGERDLDAINMMWALRLLGRSDEALALNAEYTRRPLPDWVRAKFLINEGGVYFDQRRYPEAEAAFRKALERAPNSLPAEANLASTCAQTGRLDEAESLWVDVLRVDPDDQVTRFNLWQLRARVLLGRADALERLGKIDSAIAAYRDAQRALEEAARLSPDDAAVRENARRIGAMIEALRSGGDRRTQ